MEITVLGGFGVGKTIQISRAPEVGETISGGFYSEGPGGKASNQAVQIARLGHSVGLISAVGDDSGADMGFRLWEEEGVAAEGVVRTQSPTMVGFIIVDSQGDNRIALAPGALSAMTVQDLGPLIPVIESSNLLVVSFELNPEVGITALRFARAAGVKTVCNPAPAVELDRSAMATIDILVPNYREACQLAGIDASEKPTPAELAQKLRNLGVRAVVITLGGEGAFVDTGDTTELVSALSVGPVVDTTGAGDSFVGALAVALNSGKNLIDAARFAVAVAARTVTVAEVIPALPRTADLAVLEGGV
jgi:ribokinase